MKPSDFSDIIHNYEILKVGLLSIKKGGGGGVHTFYYHTVILLPQVYTLFTTLFCL